MNLQNIFQEVEKLDPEFQERISPRRDVIKNWMGFGKKVALSALPVALSGLFTRAYGQNTRTPLQVLQFAFLLENLEAEFYKKGVAQAQGGMLSPAPAAIAVAALTTIRNDEVNHVRVLSDTIKSLNNNTAPAPMTFADFKFAQVFPDVFTNYETFLAVAQAFEDTGVRAYKGQAGFLIGNRPLLTAALNIHSVEARHASHIRQMRTARGANQKPWITLNNLGGLPTAVAAVYAGEQNTTQGGANLAGLMVGNITISAAAASESFDEPLSTQQVTDIVTPFLA